MFQELKKKYRRKYITLTILFFVLALVVLAVKAESIKLLLTPKADLYELYADEITAPMRVEADIDFIIDYYAYYTENGTTKEREYFIPVGEEEYMGVLLGGSNMTKANNNMQATWEYMDGDNEALDAIETIHVTGTILPLEGMERTYYDGYIDDLEWTEEEKEVFLPYVLKVGYIGDSDTVEFGIVMLVAGVLLICSIIWLVLGVRESYMKNIRKYCEASGSPEMAKAKLERFYEATPEVCGIRLSPEYFLSVKGSKALFAESKDIIWAYQHVVKHSVNLIPTGKTYSIMIAKADGSIIEVPMRNKKVSEAALEHIAHVLPYLFLGYDDQIQNAFKQNRQALVQAVTERRNQLYGASAPVAEETMNSAADAETNV